MITLKMCIITVMISLCLCCFILSFVDIVTDRIDGEILIEDLIRIEIGLIILIMIFAVNKFI